MKNPILFLSFLILLACENAQSEHGSDFPQLSITIENIPSTLNPKGETVPIKIKSETEWSISSNKTWITFDKTEGSECIDTPMEIKLSCEFNFFDERDAVITIESKYNDNIMKEYKISQAKYIKPTTRLQVGDPEVSFDANLYDEKYKYHNQMIVWKDAGKKDGIPYLSEQLSSVDKIFTQDNSVDEIKKFFEDNAYKEITVLLKNGQYYFDKGIRLYSNATLIGESKDGVIINAEKTIGPEIGSIISMYNAKNAGIRNLTIIGRWLNEDGNNYPKYNDLSHEELKGMGKFITVSLKGESENCFIDNVKLINNASHPIWTQGKNHTIRNVEIDGAFCKAGGCQGYFFIGGYNALITNCKVTNIRHISLQGEQSTMNVLYDNDFRQEVSFHVGDGGNNLIENNRIYITPTMFPGYNAIMGPWSNQHYVGGLNFIYNNKCKEDNLGRNGATPWSDEQLYLGPYEVSVGTDNPTRYTNFRPIPSSDLPVSKTLYPIILE